MDRILYLEGQVRRMLHEASLANQIKIMAESYKPKPWYVEDPEALFNQLQRSEERRFYYMQENERLRAGLEVPVPDPWFEV